MENSPAFFLIGALLVFTLTLTTGSYIQKSAESTIEEALSQMSAQEIEAFNNQFESYKGKQTGSQISSLCGRLIANSNTFKDTPEKVPSVECERIKADMSEGVNISYDIADEDSHQEYIDGLNTIKNHIENKHTYYVSFQYDLNGLTNKVIISYEVPEQTDETEPYIQERAQSTNEKSQRNFVAQEIEAFNMQFESYRGQNTGSQITALCGRLIANANTYKDEPDKVPAVEIARINAGDTEGVKVTFNDTEDFQNYVEGLAKIKNNVENKHTYYVSFQYDSSELVGRILIGYEGEVE